MTPKLSKQRCEAKSFILSQAGRAAPRDHYNDLQKRMDLIIVVDFCCFLVSLVCCVSQGFTKKYRQRKSLRQWDTCNRRKEHLGYIYKLLSWLKVLTNDDVLWWTPFQTLNNFDKLHMALLLNFQTKADCICNTFWRHI